MSIEVYLKREKIQLNNWMPVGGRNQNWVRRCDPYDGISCVGLMVSYSEGILSDRFHWAPMFHGPMLHELCDIYFQFYPSPRPYIEPTTGKCYSCLSKTLLTFQDFQLQEAKDHLDQFIRRVNSLAVFF